MIKICGINSTVALNGAISARVDYVGLVFFDKSPRNLTPDMAAELANQSNNAVSRVGLFVDADDRKILTSIDAGKLDAIQLHGNETPARAAEIRTQTGLPVWKALSVRTKDDIMSAARWFNAVDFILFDAKTPDNANLPGGMGIRFDWSLLSGFKSPIPWGLAGGLTAENVADAITQTGAPFVDTSSGVETSPGIKDVDKIAAFAYAVRQYDKA